MQDVNEWTLKKKLKKLKHSYTFPGESSFMTSQYFIYLLLFNHVM